MWLMILLAILLAASGAAVYFIFFSRFVTSEPNEWMLIIRNGEVVTWGIGISAHVRLGDRVVRFPSKINKVNFSAQQVTKEVQGIEINGAIIWTIYRERDGPMKAYRYLGDDLRSEEPRTANAHMVEMSNAIVRHRIANSTIDEILRNRDMVRNEIRNEMNKIVNGWGVWLESVEITDVKILSGTVFSNLQTPFREEQRIKAEAIKMNTDHELNLKRLAATLLTNKKEAETEALKTIYRAGQTLRVAEENQKNMLEEQALKKKRAEVDNAVKAEQARLEAEQRAQLRLREHEAKQREIAKQVEIETLKQKLAETQQQTKTQVLQLKLARKEELLAQTRKIHEAERSMINEVQKKSDFKFAALNSCKNIYQNLPINEMKVFNFDGNGKDPVTSFVSQVVTGISNLKVEGK